MKTTQYLLLPISPEEFEKKFVELKSSIIDELTKIQKNESKIPEEYLTIDEVGKIFKKSKTTIENWSNKGILSKYAIGASILFKRSDIDKALTRLI